MTGTDPITEITAGTVTIGEAGREQKTPQPTAATATLTQRRKIANQTILLAGCSATKSRGTEQVIISVTEKKTEVVIRFTQAGRRPPIVNLMSPRLKRGSGQFYVDTEADVTLIKRKCVRENNQLIANTLSQSTASPRENA